jgi:hypothetical protein
MAIAAALAQPIEVGVADHEQLTSPVAITDASAARR